MPNQNVMKAWVAALRSGEYDQTKGALRRTAGPALPEDTPPGYCCLGVLCDVAAKHPELGDIAIPAYEWRSDPLQPFDQFTWGTNDGMDRSEGAMPPHELAGWSGMAPAWSVPRNLTKVTEEEREDDPDRGGETRVSLAFLNDSTEATLSDIADIIEKAYVNA